jgi:hypothetical protein
MKALDHVSYRAREFTSDTSTHRPHSLSGREERAVHRLSLGSQQFDALMQRLRRHPEDLQTAAVAADAMRAITMLMPEVLNRCAPSAIHDTCNDACNDTPP